MKYILTIRILNPSIAAKINPPAKALLPAAFIPALAANIPPEAAPDIIAFQGSSFFLIYVKVQSQHENNVPQIAKLPNNIIY